MSGEGDHLDARGVVAGEAHGLFVVADGVDEAAEDGAVQDEAADQDEHDGDDEDDREDAQDGGGAELR